jgi:hypothetical protein
MDHSRHSRIAQDRANRLYSLLPSNSPIIVGRQRRKVINKFANQSVIRHIWILGLIQELEHYSTRLGLQDAGERRS